MTKSRFRLAAVVTLLAFLALSAINTENTFAASGTPDDPKGHQMQTKPKNDAASGKLSTSNLLYHNGPVMHTNTTYAIYWIPSGYSVSSGYTSVINGFFSNVAADNGKSSNVYYSDTQYKDTTGYISYNSTFGGSVTITDPLPANGCSDSYTSVCLTDSQIQAKIASVMAKQGWTAGTNKLYFLFTAKNIGSCFSSSSTSSNCAFSGYCAYHSNFSSNGTVLYANMPYADTVAPNCDAGQHPNGDDADATLNVTSHEHNEAITDPLGTAWYDRSGNEDGDKCAWTFGTALGSTAYGQYNQSIGSGKYYLQREWSNHSSGCVLRGI